MKLEYQHLVDVDMIGNPEIMSDRIFLCISHNEANCGAVSYIYDFVITYET